MKTKNLSLKELIQQTLAGMDIKPFECFGVDQTPVGIFVKHLKKRRIIMDLMRPRNTLVLVELKKKPEERRGAIYVKTDSEMFAEAEILDVGPDCISAQGGQSSTHDLKPGQRVLVQYQTVQKDQMGMVRGRREQGLKLEENVTDGRKDLYLFEQTAIMAILADPETALKLTESE